MPKSTTFRYHEVIEKIINESPTIAGRDYANLFDRLWPFAVSAQYFYKKNYRTTLQYQYDVTAVDLANILSIVASLRNTELTVLPALNVLRHFIEQPMREKSWKDFINMLSGHNNTIPIVSVINGNLVLDRLTLLLFLFILNTKFKDTFLDVSGPQRMAQLKTETGAEYERYFKEIMVKSGYSCPPTSLNVGGEDFDVIAVSEENKDILLIETKFKDPSPSSFSGYTLVDQELTYPKYGLIPQAIKQQKRYEFVGVNNKLFEKILCLKEKIQDYQIRAYLLTKHTPLISRYKDVQILSGSEFIDNILLAD